MVHEYLDELTVRLLPYVKRKGTVVEIASNDCTLLKKLKSIFQLRIGIEPASNFEQDHREAEVTYINDYFTRSLIPKAPSLLNSTDLIVARNVLAHVPDMNDFISTVHNMLTQDGIVYLEFHDGDSIIDKLQFDSIYHEHQSYITFEVIEAKLKELGFDILNTWVGPIGGSSRSIVCRKVGAKALPVIEDSIGTGSVDVAIQYFRWNRFREKCNEYCLTFKETLFELKRTSNVIYGYGASARSTTLGIFCNASDFLDGFVDSAPHKRGRYWTGSSIQIQSPVDVDWKKVDIVVIFAWNFFDEVSAVIRCAGFSGDIYKVLPHQLTKV
jgi:SAM-dependent methyltransferase